MTEQLTKIQMKGSRFSVERLRDGGGDAGALWPFDWDDKEHFGRKLEDAQWGEIRIGSGVFCGAWRTTMFGADTFWQTTPVTEILEVNEQRTYVKFKTRNSLYEAKSLDVAAEDTE